MKKALAKLLAGSLAIGILSTGMAAAAEEAGDGNIVFGLSIGLTGSLALEGDRVVKSVNMAIDEINSAGGVLGRNLEVVVEDDQGDADMSLVVAKKMGENKDVVAMLGPHMTNSVLAVDQTMRDYAMPAFVGGTALSISELDNPYIYRTRSSDRLNAAAAARYLVEDLGAMNIALLYNNVDLGIGAKGIIEEYLAEQGMKLAAAEAHSPGDVDMTGQILNVKNSGADAIIIWCYPAEAAIITRQIRELGIDLPVIGGATFTSLRPFLDYIFTGKIQHLFQGCITWKYTFGFRDFPVLAIQSLYDICRVHNTPDIIRKLEKGTYIFPIIFPVADSVGIFLSPFLFNVLKL